MNYSVVGKNNVLYGPYTAQRIIAFIEEGKIRENTILLDEKGMRNRAEHFFPSCFEREYIDLTDIGNDYSSYQNSRNNTYSRPEYTQTERNSSDTSYRPPKWTMMGSDGNLYGPYTLEELQSFVYQRRINPYTRIYNESGQESSASSILDFGSRNTSVPPGSSYRLNRSYTLPPEAQGLNWGAFFLAPLWSLCHNTWIGLLCLLPSVGWIMNFVLLFKGNEWAWQNRHFSSSQEFIEVQRAWAKWGFFITLFPIVFVFVLLMMSSFLQ